MLVKLLRKIIAYVRFRKFGIRPDVNCYIAKNCRVYGGKNVKMGKEVTVSEDCQFFVRNRLNIGKKTLIGRRNTIGATDVIIGENVLTGPNVFICDYEHLYNNVNIPIKDQGEYKRKNEPLIICDDCWLGTNVVVIGPVRIGKHCVVGANSVVNKDIPDFCVAVGNPARVVKRWNGHEWVKA